MISYLFLTYFFILSFSLANVSRIHVKTRTLNFFNVNDALYFVDVPGYALAIGTPTSITQRVNKVTAATNLYFIETR